jgi:hypothetical protein
LSTCLKEILIFVPKLPRYYGTIQVLWRKAEFVKKKHRKQSMARIWFVCTPVLQAAKFESAKEKVTQSLLDVKTEMGFQFQIHTT